MLIEQGSNPKEIQSRLGHESVIMTMDRYGHLFEGADEAVARRLDAMFEARAAHSPRTNDGQAQEEHPSANAEIRTAQGFLVVGTGGIEPPTSAV